MKKTICSEATVSRPSAYRYHRYPQYIKDKNSYSTKYLLKSAFMMRSCGKKRRLLKSLSEADRPFPYGPFHAGTIRSEKSSYEGMYQL
jgi:hypothetical protein